MSAANEVDMNRMVSAEALAQRFHETYERLAPQYGYETRKESAVEWEDVPTNNKNLMIAVCSEILFTNRKVWNRSDSDDCHH